MDVDQSAHLAPKEETELMRKLLATLLGIAIIGIASTGHAEEESKVTLQVVKMQALLKQIQAQKGKVVVIDFWGDFCIPCKKEFPNLVRMHHEYAKDGLVCMSVAVDAAEDSANSLKFLQEKKATFGNFLIDEEPEIWQEKWNISAVPAVLVYGRDGTLAKRFVGDDPKKPFTYKDVEAFIKPLLAK